MDHLTVADYREDLQTRIKILARITDAPKMYRSRSSHTALEQCLASQECAELERQLRLSYLVGPICPNEVYQAASLYQVRLHEQRKQAAMKEKINKATELMLSRLGKPKETVV